MKNNQFVILALFIIFFSCKKEEPSYTEVSGVVYEQGTINTKTVANALVEFQWRIPKTYGAEVYHLDSVRTDANGHYTISADAPDANLHVFASGHHYYPGGELTMVANVNRGRSQALNLDLIPYAWLRMHITKTGQYHNLGIGAPIGSTQAYSITTDTTIISSPVLGNTEVELTLFKYKNGLQEREQIIVQTIGHDTVDVAIEF
tara:strand:- start:1924 stop:2535 length:612 start_codon:yes stop_codon:yes gene_type:complete